MSVRIRYKKVFENALQTQQNYVLPTGQVVFGSIITDTSPMKVTIHEVDRDVVHFTGSGETLKDTKKSLKQALAAVGVVFNTELRAKKNQKELDSVEQQLVHDLKDTL